MTPRRLLAILMAALLILAACGDDSTETSTDTPPEDGGGGETPADGAFAVNIDDCEDPDAAAAPIEGEVVLATSIPTSGGPAVLFAPWGDGMQAYFDFYNESNGGIGGELPIELVLKDDQYIDSQTAANVTEILDNDDPAAFVGIIGTPNNFAVRDDLNALCVPQLFNGSGASAWGDVENYPWTMGGLIPYDVESRMFAEFVAGELPEGGNAGLFYVNNDFGQAYVDPFTEAVEESGFTIVAEETIGAEDSGAPASQMTNLVESEADVILAVPLGLGCISFMQELSNAKAANPDFDPIVYVTGTCASPIFFDAVGESATGVYSTLNFKDVNNEDLKANDADVMNYLEQITATNPDVDAGGIAPAGWSAAEAMVFVLEEAYASEDGLSRQSIIDAARNLSGYSPSLLRDGLSFNTSATDGFAPEGAQIVQWNGTGFDDIGDVVDLEGTTTATG